ncbi:MAG: hypothetical protein E6J80_03425 [Deltaproteobacteria bacterium]|nr:MAG: hypothetical protein E6J80_03425 [Deltaproteobacteria bacterium]
MATAPTRGKPTQTVSPLTLLLWQETLLSWGIPLFLIGVIAVVALLGAFGQIAQPTGVAILGCLLLLLVGFSLFRTVLTGTVEPRLKALTWGLGFAWIAITWAQLYFAVFVGQEMVSGFVSADGGGIVLPLGAQGTVYDLVVEGSFTTAAGEVGREAGYRLLLEKDGQKVQELDGVFSEHWARQRLGRRGSTTSRRLHNHVLHRLLSPGEGPYQLSIVRIDPQLTPTLHVTLYRDTYPAKTFWLLSVLLLIGAYVGELLHAEKEAPLVLVTASALAFVLTFRNLGVPPHGYQDVVGAVMIAAIAGPLGGWLFRLIADAVSKGLFPHQKKRLTKNR